MSLKRGVFLNTELVVQLLEFLHVALHNKLKVDAFLYSMLF